MTGNPAVEIIAASAGSGKTHRLATTLLEEVAAQRVRPEAVVAVTFTVKAAAELEERVRSYLVREGRTTEAQRLGASRIGTVHAVCARLLSEFAFELALSPQQNVLDAKAAALALREGLESAMTPQRARRAAALGSRLYDFHVHRVAREVVDLARINAISAEALRDCATKSWQGLREALDPPLESGLRLEVDLRAALEAFERDSPEIDTTQLTTEARHRVRSALNRLRSGRSPGWADWARLAVLKTGAKSREAARVVGEAIPDFGRHPLLHTDLEEAVRLVFDVAADALEGYQDYKRQRGSVDFTDQLALALQALRKPKVQAQLADEIDLVLVDEFQDTNPIQLAIFVELARLAKRSIWVGDQKQAIFGFLQADPALMDAAIEALLGEEPLTLDTSYRSRPELVQLTSAVFAPAFERVGIPRKRTILKPKSETEPEGLGPIVERWYLEGGSKKVRAAAIASGVKELLADPTVTVRAGGRETRRPRPDDVAVLCRTNSDCLDIADALHSGGLASVVERRGLLATPEAQLVLAGLRRWADPRDSLSAAVLARLSAPEGGNDACLQAALRRPYGEEFSGHESVLAIEALRTAKPLAGLVEVFDQVSEAVRVREVATAWGEGDQRLGNLEALRSLALTYMSECSGRRVPATLGGFLAWLETVKEAEQDARAQVGRSDAVVVSTFHGAKGLEWPITILRDQGSEHAVTALGVHVAETDQAFDFNDPLAGRWLRFWPNPFHPSQKTFLQEDLADHPFTQMLERRERRETLRLLYVSWTRARDRLIVASGPDRRLEQIFERVADRDGPLVCEPDEDEVVWAGMRIVLRRRTLTALEPEEGENTGGEVYASAGSRERSPAYLSPSSLQTKGRAGETERLGPPLSLYGSSDVSAVGEVFHRFLAADRAELGDRVRLALARDLLLRWKLESVLEPIDLASASERFRAWVVERWPEAVWRREWPVAQRLENGGVVRGFSDLVLELNDGFVVVDHKAFPASLEAARERATEYAGQLGAYVNAIAAGTGKKHVGSFIHLPLSGVVIRLVEDQEGSQIGRGNHVRRTRPDEMLAHQARNLGLSPDYPQGRPSAADRADIVERNESARTSTPRRQALVASSMPISDTRWKQFADSQYPWERDALDFLRAGLPDHEPFRAWVLMEFIADDGSISEVDALVHTPNGLYLVEIKGHPGHLGGDSYTWEWKHDGRIRSFENPRVLANRKAKKLKSLLARQPGWKKVRRRFPYLRAIVFCSATNLHCSLKGAAATDIFVRDGSAAEKDGIPGILAYLTASPANLHERLDKQSAKAIGTALEEAGLRASRSHRRLGDYELSEPLDEGAGFQDYLATRPDLPRMRRRVRLYTSATGTTEQDRQRLERAARREFQILEGLDHPGLIKAVDFKTHPLGPALIFEHDPSALRLDHHLRHHGPDLAIGERLDLLRQIAETVAYAHGHQLFHRALSPRCVIVSGVDSALQARLLDWQTGARSLGSATAGGSLLAGTAHVEDLVESSMAAYLAPESDRPEASPRQLDVFSLGALAYFLLTESPPATNRVELIRKLRDGKGLQVAELLDGATSNVQELVRWSTNPDVTERLDDVQEFLELLDGVEEELTRPEPDEVTNPLEARKGDVLEGGLKVLKRLGQGSSAVALLVEHEEEELVLKLSLRPDRNERLRQEGEVLDKLRHQSIVELRQVVEIGGHLGLLLERAGTETLGERLRRDGRLHLDLLQRFGEDLLQVVDWLEQKGIPHRDLKPDNIGVGPLSKKGRLHLVLFDFSLARTPAENLRAGTHPFLDPFLALREPPHWDLHAERYAAAITLYEMAAGAHPRWGDGRSDPATLECEVSLEAELFDPPVRETLTEFFGRALRRDPRERFDTCEEMLRDWRRVFEVAAPPQPEVSSDGLDPEAAFADATPKTQVAALGGFGTRALTVLDRQQVLTVDDFLRYPLGRLLHARGVGYKTRKEISAVHRVLSARFDVAPVPDEPPVTETETEEAEVSSIDLLAAGLLPRNRGQKPSPAKAALVGLEPTVDLPPWPSQSDVARAVGVSRARVGQLVGKLRRRWRKSPSLNRLRQDLVETVEAKGGVLTADQLADALLAARGSAHEEPLRSRLTAAVTRAAIEAESDLENPRIRMYRKHGRLLVAIREDQALWAARLGRAADELAQDDPLPSAARVREELEAIEPPAGATPISPENRLRLAAGASEGAAVSSRQELYPCGLSAERALRLAMGALMGARELAAEQIRSRVAARYPEATPLPERPELDRLLEEAGTGLVWSAEGGGSFVSRFNTEAFTPGSGSSLTRWATTTGGHLLPVSPEVSAARGFEERLGHSLKQGGFLALTVRPRHLLRAEAELVQRYSVSRVSLEERLLGAMRAVAKEVGVDWSVVLSADASGAESPEWRNLRRLVDRAIPTVEAEIGASERAVLLVHSGLLTRYDQLGLLERLRDQAGTRDGLPGLWVLIPSDDQEELPVLDGQPVPVITPGQWARIPDSWLKNLHRTGAGSHE